MEFSQASYVDLVGSLVNLGYQITGAQISGLLMARNLDPSRYSHEIVLHQRGPLADVQKAAMDAGVHDRFRFLGFQYPILPWIASFDLLLVPSVGEAFGRTIVEAMLVGTTVVASDSGGHTEIIANEKTGFLVPPDDVSAMCRAARKLVDDRDLRGSIANEAKEFARERYSVADHVDSVMNVYDTVLSDWSQSASSNT
jgi:glycosyltransferase involved in cell wall biosynthesis